MAGLARVDMEETKRGIVPIDATVRFDRAEEVRRRWVSIAAYYIAQRQNFEQRAELELDDVLEEECGFTPPGKA